MTTAADAEARTDTRAARTSKDQPVQPSREAAALSSGMKAQVFWATRPSPPTGSRSG